ncbi:hypothetical protein ACN47E_006195 [Coniothyrium glycines]
MTSATQNPLLKQMAALRRKPNLTRKEFFDYHFQVHGSISDVPQNEDEKPHKYIQTHFFDAAFGAREDGIAGTGNHSWVGRDDMTELYFRDWDHLKACFSSKYVRETIGPDGVNFGDLETSIPLFVTERVLELSHTTSLAPVKEGERTVAVLFVATTSQESEEQVEQRFSPLLIKALADHATDDAWGLQANVSVPSEQFDVRAYFGGKNMPEYPVSYKIFLKDHQSVKAIRKAQKAFMAETGDVVDASKTFIVFGKEGMVLDVGNGVKFESHRQPVLPY